MANRDLFQLMLVSHRGPVLKGRIRLSVAFAALAVGIAGCIVVAALAVGYHELSASQAADNERLRAENASLEIENRNLSLATRQLNLKIDRLEKMSVEIQESMQSGE